MTTNDANDNPETAESSLPGYHTTIILTPRLLLRPLSYKYMPGIFAYRANGAIVHWKEPDKSMAQSREWLTNRLSSPKCWNFVVHLRPSSLSPSTSATSDLLNPSEEDRNAVIGLIGAHQAPEIGYSFHPSVWGRGVASEAVAALVDKYWEVFPEGHPSLEGEERRWLEGHTAKVNLASQAVLKKNGFEFWKEVEEEVSLGQGPKEMMMVWRKWKPGFQHPEQVMGEAKEKEVVEEGVVKESLASSEMI